METSFQQPLEKVFHCYKNNRKVEIWERNTSIRHTGHIMGFDEYVNIVFQTEGRRFFIKGDCISCILFVDEQAK